MKVLHPEGVFVARMASLSPGEFSFQKLYFDALRISLRLTMAKHGTTSRSVSNGRQGSSDYVNNLSNDMQAGNVDYFDYL